IIDTASGLARTTLELCRPAHELIVVVTPETVSCSDAYGLMKTLGLENALARSPRLVVNLANTPEEAEEVTNRMRMFARHFLRLEIDALGIVPYDPSVTRAVRAQEPVSLLLPQSPAALPHPPPPGRPPGEPPPTAPPAPTHAGPPPPPPNPGSPPRPRPPPPALKTGPPRNAPRALRTGSRVLRTGPLASARKKTFPSVPTTA